MRTSWRDPADHVERFSFTTPTVNAAGHPIMQRFHRPEGEKRIVVIIDSEHQYKWHARANDEAPRYFRPWTGALENASRRRRCPGGRGEGPPPRELPEQPKEAQLI